MAETGEVVITPTEQPAKKAVSFAEHFVSKHPEIKQAHEGKPEETRGLSKLLHRGEKDGSRTAEETFSLAKEAYDLFLERQDLRAAIQRSKREGGEAEKAAEALSLEEKRYLISKGRVSEILSTVTQDGRKGSLVPESKQRVQEIEDRLKEVLSRKEVYERYQEGFEHEMGVIKQAKEVANLEELSEALKLEELRVTRRAWVKGKRLTTTETTFIQDNVKLQREIRNRINEVVTDPEVFATVRVRKLQEYQRQLKSDRFAETPSRKELVDRIGTLIAEGKKILLTGETGTGKTELWFHTARELFETKGQYVTGRPDLTLYEVYGRTGIGRQEGGERGDVFREGKLTKSFHSRDGKGEPFLWDEFDNTKNEVIMGTKTHLNARPGTTISIQMDGERDYTIGSDWAFGATANIKSARYQTRVELDPAIVRMFDESVRVGYMPPDELYDILVASMLDKRGGLSLTTEDAQDTLAHYVDAIDWIQSAFQGKKVFTNREQTEFLPARGGATTGKPATLKEAILDPGRALSMLAGYEQAKAKGVSLRNYLNEQIFRFIDNENYPEDDRYYLVEIFALKGFFGDWDAGRFGLAGLDTSTLRRWNAGVKAGAEIDSDAYIPPEQVALLDPCGKLKEHVQEGVDDLLGETKAGRADLGQFQTPIEAVGDITQKETSKDTHYQYLLRIEDIGKQVGSLDMRKEAIRLLEEYSENGAFTRTSSFSGAVDRIDSLTSQAKQKAEELRQLTFKESQDLSVIKEFIGDITTQKGSKQTHISYLNRVHEIGLSAVSLNVLKEAIRLLEEYSENGAFTRPSSYFGAVDSIDSLTSQAKQKAEELRVKMMTM